MKKFIFSKVAGWQFANLSHIPWGFYLIKKFVKIVFFASFFIQDISVAACKLCLAQLDYSLHVFLISPVCCFVMFTPIIKFKFHNGRFEHCKEVLGIWDKDWHLTER